MREPRRSLRERWHRWWNGYAEVDEYPNLVFFTVRSPAPWRIKKALEALSRHPMVVAIIAAVVGCIVGAIVTAVLVR